MLSKPVPGDTPTVQFFLNLSNQTNLNQTHYVVSRESKKWMGQNRETSKICSVDEPPGRGLGKTAVSQGCFPVYGLRHWDRFPTILDRT